MTSNDRVTMLILNSKEIHQALPMHDAVQAMKRAMIALTNGHANIPVRTHLDIHPHQGTTLIMPGYVMQNDSQQSDDESLVVKVVSIFNQNQQQQLPNILGIVNVLDPRTGRPIAILDASAVTAIRTAATSGAATDALASPDARKLAIIGSGTQARSHFEAMCAVREIKRAVFYAPNRQKVESLIASLQTGVEVLAASSSDQATRDADIVCTTTNSSTPVILDQAIKPGCHINAIGSYKPSVVEIPRETVIRSRIFVDHLETALSEAGDLIQPIERGEMKRDHIVGEIGHVFAAEIQGRQTETEITLFKSVGNTAQDAVAARLIVERAAEAGLGQDVSF